MSVTRKITMKTGVKRMGPGAGFPDTFPCGCACVGYSKQKATMLILENGDRLCACGRRWRGTWIEAAETDPSRYPRFGVRHLRALPTIDNTQGMDLKLETHGFRYWVSRMTAVDGELNGVYVEKFVDGKWIEHDRYGDPVRQKGRPVKNT